MTEVDLTSDSEIIDPNKITDAESCLNYLKRREIFLYKMMNDPGHKAMLYFLEVLMNSGGPITVEELAARFTHKTFSQDMREACGGGSSEGLKEFLTRYPSLFNVKDDGQVTSVGIELSDVDGFPENYSDINGYCSSNSYISDNHSHLGHGRVHQDESLCSPHGRCQCSFDASCKSAHKVSKLPLENGCTYSAKCASTVSLLSIPSNASTSSGSVSSMNKLEASNGTQNRYDNNISHKRRGSNPSLFTNSRAGISQQPCFHEQLMKQNVSCSSCTTCPQIVSGNPYMHCPLIGISCHHQCSITHHLQHHHLEQVLSNALCPIVNPSCHSNLCSFCNNHTTKRYNIRSFDTKPQTIYALPPIEKLELETEAVRFFQQKLLKREERWVPIKSLAGHLSQASQEVRAVVGPQIDFRGFLLKHPHVFEIQGELVSVRNAFDNPNNSRKHRFSAIRPSFSSTNLTNFEFTSPTSQPLNGKNGTKHVTPRPKSLVITGAVNTSVVNRNFTDSPTHRQNSENRRSTHFSDHFVTATYPSWDRFSQSNKSVSTSNTENSNTPSRLKTTSKVDLIRQPSTININNEGSLSLSMSANEYRTIMFMRKALNTTNQTGLDMNTLLELIISEAPESVKSTIGWTNVELEEFLCQYPTFFIIEKSDEKNNHTSIEQSKGQDNLRCIVYNKRLDKMINIIITRTKPPNANARSLINQSGRIYHVTKLWGIIDLGKHEHVFFDKSIFKHVDDLQKYFKVNELLYFNAILAQKESRAKWRATQVWKECDRTTIEKLGTFNGNAKDVFSDPDLATTDSIGEGNWRHSIPNGDCTTLSYSPQPDYEDTEADEEIEDIIVDRSNKLDSPLSCATETSMRSTTNQDIINQTGNRVNGVNVSEIARNEGLNLASDMRFISKDPTDLTNKNSRLTTSTQDNVVNSAVSNSNLNGILSCSKSVELRSNHVSSSTEHNPKGRILMGYAHKRGSVKDDYTTSTSSASSTGKSIAVQTVSTGNIMVSQLYHDMEKTNGQHIQM